jgi:hypothetical protein
MDSVWNIKHNQMMKIVDIFLSLNQLINTLNVIWVENQE